MGLTFGNPLGFLGLLAVPAVLAIHFLQRRARRERVTTLFLLAGMQRESEGGRTWERLRHSIPLWCQLLAVLCLTWILAEPRRLERNSVQRVALVLDGSASMEASRSRVLRFLADDLRDLTALTSRTEFHVLDSRRERARLHHGTDVGGVLAAVEAWQPEGGTHDPAPALRLARSLVGSEGLVWFVTDHVTEALPAGATCQAMGEAMGNVGIAGVTVEEKDGRTVWRALLRNHADEAQSRTWRVVDRGGAAGPEERVNLPPRGTVSVQGAFPDGADGLVLRLEPDGFAVDDTVPLVKPRARRLAVLAAGGAGSPDVWRRLFDSLPDVDFTADAAAADLEVLAYDPLDPREPERAAVVFVKGEGPADVLTGAVLVERHALTQELNWQAVTAEGVPGLPAREGDEVLVWIGDRPLVFLRGPAERPQLCCNFDPARSNALRLPAMVVTVHRFLEGLRARAVKESAENVDCGQRLVVPVRSGEGAPHVTLTWEPAAGGGSGETITLSAAQAAGLTAPAQPAFFTVRQGDRLLLTGAAAFRDVREADFTRAATRRDGAGAKAEAVARWSRSDAHWRLWLLGALGFLTVAWAALGRRKRGTGEAVSGGLPEGA